ncbi:MAG: sigma-70 family RNA polymerase sigma factor, partial [Planctomycetota bacterium]
MNPPKDLSQYDEFLHRISRRLVFDEHNAEDLCQEAWVALLEKVPAAQLSLYAWLAGTVRNLSRMFYRTERRRRERESLYAALGRELSPDTTMEGDDIRERVVGALFSLKEPVRTTLVLRYYQNLSYKEIAGSMDVPLGTMKARLRQGLDQIRKRLDSQHNNDRRRWTAALLPFLGIRWDALRVSHERNTSSAITLLEKPQLFSLMKTTMIGMAIVAIAGFLILVLSGSAKNEPISVSTTKEVSLSHSPQRIGYEMIANVADKMPIQPGELASSTVVLGRVAWQGALIDYTGFPLGNVIVKLETQSWMAEGP